MATAARSPRPMTSPTTRAVRWPGSSMTSNQSPPTSVGRVARAGSGRRCRGRPPRGRRAAAGCAGGSARARARGGRAGRCRCRRRRGRRVPRRAPGPARRRARCPWYGRTARGRRTVSWATIGTASVDWTRPPGRRPATRPATWPVRRAPAQGELKRVAVDRADAADRACARRLPDSGASETALAKATRRSALAEPTRRSSAAAARVPGGASSPVSSALVEVDGGEVAEAGDGDVEQFAGGGLQVEGVADAGAGLVEQGEVAAGAGGLAGGDVAAGDVGAESGDADGAAGCRCAPGRG